MNLKEEVNECYICTDPTIEHSPCQCKAPVHMNCLLEWVKKNDNRGVTCSICHEKLEGIEPYSPEPKKSSHHGDPLIRYRRDRIRCMIRLWSFTRFVIFMVCGYVGKFFVALLVEPSWMSLDDYWSPFDLLFIVCASVISVFIVGGIRFAYKMHTYISRRNSQQYEEFNDSGSDSDAPV